jgi:hypothetical protein
LLVIRKEHMPKKQATEPANDFPTGLAAPAQRALSGAGYTRLARLAGASEADILALHGMVPKALEQLRRALAEQGLAFAVPAAGENQE